MFLDGVVMAEKLTPKQEKWLNAYVETGNATEAARRAGYKGNDQTLRAVGYQNLTKLHIPVGDLLDKMGLDDGVLVTKLKEGLNSELVVVAKFEGSITDERSYVDFSTRARYLDIALRLKGKYPSEKIEHGGVVTQKIEVIEVVKEREPDSDASNGDGWEEVPI